MSIGKLNFGQESGNGLPSVLTENSERQQLYSWSKGRLLKQDPGRKVCLFFSVNCSLFKQIIKLNELK